MNLCVSFDFDGVVVDTVSLLYDTYLKILGDYNVTGNADEFEYLNGLSLKEIVNHILAAHEISATTNQLTDRYASELIKIYESVALNNGISELLDYLNDKQIKMTLVSGAPYSNIDKTIERLGIKKYFYTIVSGDDVKQSKPNSEIYEELKSRMPDHIIWAVEDSLNGIVSAIAAGLNTVYFDKYGKRDLQSISNANYTIHDFCEVKAIIYAAERHNFSIRKLCPNAKISFIKDSITFSKELEERLDNLWVEALKENERLFNGRIACYLSSEIENDSLAIKIFASDYKHFRFKNYIIEQSGIRIAPLAVSGVIIDNENNTLIGTRSKVSQYDSWIELIPSGGIEHKNADEVNTPEEQIMIELFEEANIGNEHVKSVEAICLLYDEKDNVYDVGLKILMDNSLEQLLHNGCIRSTEYTDIRVINAFELAKSVDEYRMTPTSAALLCHI